MSKHAQELRGGLTEVTLPESTDAEEFELYRRYRELGGMAIEGYEERLTEGKQAVKKVGLRRPTNGKDS